MTSSKHKGHGHVTETPDVSHIRNVDVTHEMGEVHIRGVLTFVVGLTVMTIAVYFLMWGMFRLLNKQEESKEPDRSPMALSEKERMPPEPRLQAAPGFGEKLETETGAKESREPKASPTPKDPLWEIEVLRRQWNEVLLEGAKDPSGKVVSLPISEAMEKVLQGSGLPSRTQPGAAHSVTDYGADLPTAASAGRMTERGRQ
jgi:hypothetical protein